jgi:hypothetical protein
MAFRVGDELNYRPSESEKQTDHCASRPVTVFFSRFIPADRDPGEGAADGERTCRPPAAWTITLSWPIIAD